MILYMVPRSIGPLYIPTDIGKGTRALLSNFEGARPPKGLNYNPGKDVKGNGSWRNTRNPTLMH